MILDNKIQHCLKLLLRVLFQILTPIGALTITQLFLGCSFKKSSLIHSISSAMF